MRTITVSAYADPIIFRTLSRLAEEYKNYGPFTIYKLSLGKILSSKYSTMFSSQYVFAKLSPDEYNHYMIQCACEDVLAKIRNGDLYHAYYSKLAKHTLDKVTYNIVYSRLHNHSENDIIRVPIEIAHYFSTTIRTKHQLYKLMKLIDILNEAATDLNLLAKLLITRSVKFAEYIECKYPDLWEKIFNERPDINDVIHMYDRHTAVHRQRRQDTYAGYSAIIAVRNLIVNKYNPPLYRMRPIVTAYHVWKTYLDQWAVVF